MNQFLLKLCVILRRDPGFIHENVGYYSFQVCYHTKCKLEAVKHNPFVFNLFF